MKLRLCRRSRVEHGLFVKWFCTQLIVSINLNLSWITNYFLLSGDIPIEGKLLVCVDLSFFALISECSLCDWLIVVLRFMHPRLKFNLTVELRVTFKNFRILCKPMMTFSPHFEFCSVMHEFLLFYVLQYLEIIWKWPCIWSKADPGLEFKVLWIASVSVFGIMEFYVILQFPE